MRLHKRRLFLWLATAIGLLILIARQIKLAVVELGALRTQEQIRSQVKQAVEENRRLQLQLVKLESTTTKEMLVRDKLLMGFPQEKVYLYPKGRFNPPPLKQVRVID